MVTDAVGEELELVLREEEVGEVGEAAHLLRQALQLVLREVELREALQLADLLRGGKGKGRGRINTGPPSLCLAGETLPDLLRGGRGKGRGRINTGPRVSVWLGRRYPISCEAAGGRKGEG